MSLPGEIAMSFKQLPKEKRNNLVLVALLTAIALGGLGFGLIRFQYDSLKVIASETDDAGKKLHQMKDGIARADQIENELAEISKTLAAQEENMVFGDSYSWGLDMIRRVRAAYKVDVPVINQPVPGESTLLPKFPYKQAAFTVGGTGFYHDVGKFIADFENQFPQIRVVNLSLDPISSLVAAEQEKLEFKMDVVALVRPNQN
jgi:Tfp pilus assembly protein PilO